MNRKNLGIMAVTAVVLLIILLLSWQASEEPSDPGSESAEAFVDGILSGDYESAYALLSDEAAAVYDGPEAFGSAMSAVLSSVSSYGQVTGTGGAFADGGHYGLDIRSVPVYAQYGAVRLNMFYDADGGIQAVTVGAWELPSDAALPSGLTEEDVQVVTGGLKPLDGKLTSSDGSDHSVAVVLLQGSGSSSMDETVGPNHIFQQLAWGLAEKGVDVLRYDKRTYADAGFVAMQGAALTVKEEYIDDAVSAGAMLREMGYGAVYVVGHSLGGTMAPVIVELGDGLFDGFVSLAGTPRDLVDLMYVQIQNQLAALPDGAEKDAYLAYYASEYALAQTIPSMTTEQLLTTAVFGATAYYWKTLSDYDAAGTAAGLDCPMLFLQGSLDIQVFADEDFEMWQEVAPGHAEFVLLDGLNHLFCEPGANAGTGLEYYDELTVSAEAVSAVADFVLGL